MQFFRMRSQFSSKQDSYIPRFTSEDNNTGGTISPNRQGRQGNFFLDLTIDH